MTHLDEKDSLSLGVILGQQAMLPIPEIRPLDAEFFSVKVPVGIMVDLGRGRFDVGVKYPQLLAAGLVAGSGVITLSGDRLRSSICAALVPSH